MSQSRIIIIFQDALMPWIDQVDLIDAALIYHVLARKEFRARQLMITDKDREYVWVHYPTVLKENWLIKCSIRTLKRRFSKLVMIGILVRKQIPWSKENGDYRGSKACYALSEAFKASKERCDRIRRGHS